VAGELSFFELGVKDAGKRRVFYEALFGWGAESSPSGEGFVFRTPNVPGGIHGDDEAASPYLFFQVDDIEAAAARVVELGGWVSDADVVGEEVSLARFGRFKLCRDDQGSPFGVHQAPAAPD
jgi:predicted enzyme related to lactoylglutathione lyase